MQTIRQSRQSQVYTWAHTAFGQEEASSLPHRGLRLLEEATEAAQAAGLSKEKAHELIDYVYSRPVGNLKQEIGGVSITLLALGNAAGVDVDVAETDELQRILSKPIEHWRARNQKKNDAGLRAA